MAIYCIAYRKYTFNNIIVEAVELSREVSLTGGNIFHRIYIKYIFNNNIVEAVELS